MQGLCRLCHTNSQTRGVDQILLRLPNILRTVSLSSCMEAHLFFLYDRRLICRCLFTSQRAKEDYTAGLWSLSQCAADYSDFLFVTPRF